MCSVQLTGSLLLVSVLYFNFFRKYVLISITDLEFPFLIFSFSILLAIFTSTLFEVLFNVCLTQAGETLKRGLSPLCSKILLLVLMKKAAILRKPTWLRTRNSIAIDRISLSPHSQLHVLNLNVQCNSIWRWGLWEVIKS